MSDLISREAIVKKLRRIATAQANAGAYLAAEACEAAAVRIEREPAVDAEPVRHSAWENEGDGYYFCKACKKYIVVVGGDADLNYCPSCGARMDGETNET